MSSVQEKKTDLDNVIEGLDIDTSKLIRDNDLDINQAGKEAVLALARYRANRKEMIHQKEALESAIKRLDKRIAISLETLRIIGTPT